MVGYMFKKVVSPEDKKLQYAERVTDYLKEIMPYRGGLTQFPTVPAPTTKLYAANMEFIVYCNDGSQVVNEQLLEAYKVIMTYRFPMRMNPLNAPKIEALPEDERELLYRDEVEFILTKIQEINPAFCISTIPKSLYQLLFFVANEKEQEAAFTKNGSFFTTPKRANYLSTMNEHEHYNDGNSVANVNRPVFGFGYNSDISFTNPNDREDYYQHCLTYLACPIVAQEWCNTNMFLIDLLSIRGLLGDDLDRQRLKDLTIGALDSMGYSTSFNLNRNARKSFMSKERYRHQLFASDEKTDYLRGMTLATVLREWDLRMGNRHSIYRGGDENKLKLATNDRDYTYSFSDGLFGGIVHDCIDGMAFRYTKAGYCHIKDLPIQEYGQVSNKKKPIFLPPIPAIAAALGAGEYHHPRTLLSEEAIKKGKFSGLSIFHENAKQIPPSLAPVLTNQGATCAENEAACADLFRDVTILRLEEQKVRTRECITLM